LTAAGMRVPGDAVLDVAPGPLHDAGRA
jgi:hypothetical protein